MIKKLGYSLTLLTLIVVACAETAAEPKGKCEVTVSGGFEEQFSGSALHMVQSLETGDMLVMGLYRYASDTDLTTISLIWNASAVAPGSYRVVADYDEDDVIVNIMVIDGERTFIGGPASGEGVFEDGQFKIDAPTGSLVITSANDDRIVGTLSFPGEMAVLGEGDEVLSFQVQATFESVAGKAEDLPGILGKPAMSQ